MLSNQPTRNIFDIGANIGQTATLYRELFPDATVFSFEPFSSTFAELVENFASDPKVLPFQLAVSDEVGMKDFFANADHTTSSLLEPADEVADRLKSKMTTSSKDSVQCVTLDSFCEEHDIETIDLLKMDIQGAELQAIAGATNLFQRHRISLVFCEVLFSPLYKNACDFSSISDAMSSYGYPLYGLYNLQHFVDDGLMWGDAIFVNPSLLKAKKN